VWIYLLQLAQFSDFKQLKRGQARTSIPEIMEACSWYSGFRKEIPSKDQIFQILEWLRKPHGEVDGALAGATMITTTKATQGMLVNIDNYSFYQDPRNYGSNDGSIAESEAAATREQRQPDNINKKENKEKKEINNTSSKNKFSEDSVEVVLSKELFSCIKNNNSEAREPNFQTWAKSIGLMLRKDKRTVEGIRQMILFSQNNEFWSCNILSTSKLREKFDQLMVQSRKRKQAANDDWRDF
jgi:hypothetical protein